MSVKFVYFIFASASVFGYSQASVPSYINVCKRSDPKVEECIMNAIESLRPKLVKGIPELDVPSFEPWRIPDEFVLLKGGDLKAIGTDVRVWGISKFIIKSLKADIQKDKVKFEFEVMFPNMDIEANYDIDLRILTIYIRGTGPLQSNNTDVDAKAVLKGEVVDREGRTHLEYKEADLKVKWTAGNIRFDNLFNGDKTLGKAVNNAINQNRKAVMDALKPKMEEMVAKHVMAVANKINDKFTYEELFPEN